jgi:plastocyanin
MGRTLTRVLVVMVVAIVSFSPGWLSPSFARAARVTQTTQDLPPVAIDALDDDQWSIVDVVAAPGQTLVVTNRGVEPHTFTVPAWGLNVTLPSLQPVEITVPDDVRPGDVIAFWCSSANHQRNGQEGTITVVSSDDLRASLDSQSTVSTTVQDRVVVETRDDFQFSPATLEVTPGGLIEVRNNGAIEHHFVVDEWSVNETISPGDVALVRVPADLQPGDRFTFYCSVPGHQASGMEGTIIVTGRTSVGTTTESGPAAGSRSQIADLSRFLPDPQTFGEGWTQLRSGNASAVIDGRTDFNLKVFPGEGLGAAYVGPSGSRATVVVMPFATTAVPANQVLASVLTVQASMTQAWDTDPHAADRMERLPPPPGCDVANRESGLAPIFTLPAGSTVCQLRNAGVAIFVSVEGEIEGEIGVEAADVLISRLLAGM